MRILLTLKKNIYEEAETNGKDFLHDFRSHFAPSECLDFETFPNELSFLFETELERAFKGGGEMLLPLINAS